MKPHMGDSQSDGAPVVQLLMTLAFQEAIVGIGLLELAEIAALYRDEFPVFGQIGRAGPMGINPNEVAVMIGGMPRISLSTGDARYNIFLQEDRLSFGWNRTSPLDSPHDYPGFSATYKRLKRHIERLSDWSSRRGQTISPGVGEVVYTDAFQIARETNLGDIYALFAPTDELPVSAFTCSWNQPWPSERGGYVSGAIEGPVLSAEGVTTTTLETTARFWSGGNWEACDAAFEEAHDAITSVFEKVVKPEARAKSA